MFDLVLKGGRVLDPAQKFDSVADVAFAGGKVAAIGKGLAAKKAKDVRDVTGKIVTPGLIDLHTHVYWGGTSVGVEPDAYAKQSGCTTLIDAGTAGPANMMGFRKHVIERAECRILPYLNISFPGIFAFSAAVMVGECADLRLLDPRECVRVGREHADLIVGIKVRIGRGAGGETGMAPLDMAIQAAEELGLPVMAHLDHPPPHRPDVMARMRGGDVITHCFRPFPNNPSKPGGGVHADVTAARKRGVIFDIGHGKGSFGYETAKAMLKSGFLPDVISSDVHVLSIKGPAYDLLHTMSKFLAMGMPLAEIVRANTINAALAVRKSDRGTLKTGLLGDATVMEVKKGKFEFEDVLGERFKGTEHLACRGIVLGGRWWHGGER
ncbi:MAG: amidohydrolase/deacetylase family metallohydrolase [Alphaproteobacteria bacterium]|nr:amidohydrolase/deacetylase family metallohydrolase [Alphaproteobacteria bacterium]